MTSLPRRALLRSAALLCGAAALSACSPSGAATAPPTAPAQPSAAPSPSALANLSPSPSPSPSALAAPAGAGAGAGSGALVTVNGAWVALVANMLILPLADEGGYFQKYGISLDLNYVNGSSTGLAGLTSSSLDTITASGQAVISAQAAGADVVMVMGFVNQALYRILTSPDVSSLDDLKGKLIATSKVGSSTDYFFWTGLMQYLGWGPTDLQFISAGDVPGQIALVQQGQAQSTALSPPNDIAAEDVGLHTIFDSATINLPDIGSSLIVERAYLASHRATVLNVAKACVEGIHRWKTDESFTEAVFTKYLKPTDPRFAPAGWAAYKDVLPEQPFPSRQGVVNDIPMVAASNPPAANVNPDQTFDSSIVQELVDSGFIQQIYGD